MKACITFGKVCLILAWVAWISNGCARKETDDPPAPVNKLVLPKKVLDSIFTKEGLDKDKLLDKILKNGMRIHEGTNPPEIYHFADVAGRNVAGVNFIVEHACIYDEKNPANKGTVYGKYEESIRIQTNQSLNPVASVTYSSVGDPKHPEFPDSLDAGTGTGFASGDKNNFTIFYKVADAAYENIRYDALWIISGTVAGPPNPPHIQRITDVTKCLVMLNKRGTDPGDKKLANKGTIRIFKDNDLDWVQPDVILSGLSPAEGQGGTTVTITGSGFSTTPGENIVQFGATQVAVQAATTTQLTVVVPPGPPGGTVVPVTVRVRDKTSNPLNPLLFTYNVRITSLSPDTTRFNNSTIEIIGSGFSLTLAENIVRFGAAPASVLKASPTKLTVVVPLGPPGGTIVPVAVQVKDKISNQLPFTYGVIITQLSPVRIEFNNYIITITGSGFSLNEDENIVRFNATPTKVLSATANELTVVVPQVSRPIQVTVQVKNKISNPLSFSFDPLE
jgi:hypothetical protein